MFSPLPECNWIRTLRVQQSHPHVKSKLVITLELLDIDLENVDYDALSYTWGHPISTPECEEQYDPAYNVQVCIAIEDVNHELFIMRNLYEAFTSLWNMNHRRRLWVDALCVNQNDLAEKSQQVLKMGEIFSKAQQVIVWVGLDDLDEPTFDHFVWLHSTVLDRCERYIREHDELLSHSDIKPMYHGEIQGLRIAKIDTTLPWESIRAFARFYKRRRYLGRAWIRQELVLAKNDPVILLGRHSCTGQTGPAPFAIRRKPYDLVAGTRICLGEQRTWPRVTVDPRNKRASH